MKTTSLTLIVLVNLAVLVLLAIFTPYLMISPGQLIDGHADLATDCFACHTLLIGSTPAKCIQCHKVAEIGIETGNRQPDRTARLVQLGFRIALLPSDASPSGPDCRPAPRRIGNRRNL